MMGAVDAAVFSCVSLTSGLFRWNRPFILPKNPTLLTFFTAVGCWSLWKNEPILRKNPGFFSSEDSSVDSESVC